MILLLLGATSLVSLALAVFWWHRCGVARRATLRAIQEAALVGLELAQAKKALATATQVNDKMRADIEREIENVARLLAEVAK